MTDIIGAMAQGWQMGQQMTDARNKRSLSSLMQQGYSAPKEQRGSLLAQMAGIDHGAAAAMQKQFDANDDRSMQEVVRAARTLAVLPPDQQAAYYQQELPKFRSMGLPLPDQMDDSVRDSVTKIAQAWSGAEQKDNTPSDIRTLQMLRDNPELMALYERKARAGWQPQIKSADDGSLWGVDPATMSGQRVNLGGAPSLPMPQGAQGVQALYDDLLKPFPGTQVTSIVRSPEHNARVGGKPNSQHLPHRGTARDVVPPREQWDDVAAAARARGVQVIDEGDHLHFQQGRGAMAAGPTFGRKPAPKDTSVRQMTPEQVSAAGLPAGTVAQVDANGRISVLNKPDARPGTKGLSAGEAAKVRATFKDTREALGMFKAFDQALTEVPNGLGLALDGAAKGRLGTAYNNARASLRILYNTGVLQPGELPMLENALRDPTSLSAMMDPRSRPQLRAQLDELYNTITRSIENQVSSYPQIFDQQTYEAEKGARAPQAPAAPAGNGWSIRPKGQ